MNIQTMDFSEFWTICSLNGIILDETMNRNIQRFEQELTYWNERINLISRLDTKYILEKHILHSLVILKYEKISYKARVIDVGCGAGFPGTIIKIARPDIFLTLIDSVKKKLKIAEMLARHTGLRNITAFSTRVETFAQDSNNWEKFDYVVSRAVASTDKLVRWTDKLLKANGKFIFLKGGDLRKEIDATKKYFPSYVFHEIAIDLIGFDYFKKEDKKVLIIEKSI